MKGVLLEDNLQDLDWVSETKFNDQMEELNLGPSWLLCIGPNSSEVGENMKGLGYKTLKFSLFEKAMQWLSACLMKQIPMPAAIICDTRISGEAVFKKVSRMKKSPGFSDLSVILISGLFDEIEKKEAIIAGADDYYSKGGLNIEDIDFRIKFIKEFIQTDDTEEEEEADDAKIKSGISRVNSSPMKRGFDIVISAGILLTLSPLLLVIAVLIKLDSKGPVFYISKRAGTGYRIFDFYKFRSMKTGADNELAELAELNKYENEENGEEGGPVFFKLKNDPRITRLGSFLRKTSLDELPQLLNVLKGDMSLVGNRPLPLYEAEMLTKDQWAMRFLAPAGITGLWQVTKKDKKDMTPEERLELDITYSMDNSFWKDLRILLKTIPAAFQSEEQL